MLTIFITLIGGLGLFIFGMNLMSRGIEKVAGNKLRDILKAFTKNRFLGLLTGLFFTAVIQSSSAATVMTVTFVNSGLMKLSEACGIILGANIGTTVTAMLVAFKLSAIAPIFVLAGAIMTNYIKTPMVRKSGEIVLGFGILFLGISMMSGAMAELREIPEVITLFSQFTNPFLGVLLGLVITSVVQSSSVTVSILVVMASQGLVDLHICMYVILGCNIGACTSAVLASFGGTKNAKRTALIHLLFNVFGTILMFILISCFPTQIENIIYLFSGHGTDSGTLGRTISWSHLLFKVFQVLVFYPFMDLIVKLTYVIVPGDDEEEEGEGFQLQYIGGNSLPNPTVAIYMATQEIERMANMAFANLYLAVDCLLKRDIDGVALVFENEKYVDFLDEKISSFLVKINQNTLPLADAGMIAAYFHVVSDIERIGDHATSIASTLQKFRETDIQLSEKSIAELTDMMEIIHKILDDSLHIFLTKDISLMKEVSILESQADQMERDLQKSHIRRLNKGKCTAQAGIYFNDIVSVLERVSDHATDMAFSIVESKNPDARLFL